MWLYDDHDGVVMINFGGIPVQAAARVTRGLVVENGARTTRGITFLVPRSKDF